MAEPLLRCPSSFLRGTLEPDPSLGLIERVETGATPSTVEEAAWDGDIPWLTPRDLARGDGELFVSTTERTISEYGLRRCAAKIMPTGTVMLTKRAPVGIVAVNVVPMATNQGFLNFVCGQKIRPAYLAWWFRANRRYLDKVANGSTYPELYKSDLFELQIAVPTLEEQDRALALLSALAFVASMSRSMLCLRTNPEEIAAMQSASRQSERLIGEILEPLLSGVIDLGRVRLPEQLRLRSP